MTTGFPATVLLILSFILYSKVYALDFPGAESVSAPAPAPVPGKQVAWCVARKGVDPTALGAAMDYACSDGNGTCDPIQPEGLCYGHDSLFLRASYAFSSYWAQLKQYGATCDFGGLAQQTTHDPSYASCKFPSITL